MSVAPNEALLVCSNGQSRMMWEAIWVKRNHVSLVLQLKSEGLWERWTFDCVNVTLTITLTDRRTCRWSFLHQQICKQQNYSTVESDRPDLRKRGAVLFAVKNCHFFYNGDLDIFFSPISRLQEIAKVAVTYQPIICGRKALMQFYRWSSAHGMFHVSF